MAPISRRLAQSGLIAGSVVALGVLGASLGQSPALRLALPWLVEGRWGVERLELDGSPKVALLDLVRARAVHAHLGPGTLALANVGRLHFDDIAIEGRLGPDGFQSQSTITTPHGHITVRTSPSDARRTALAASVDTLFGALEVSGWLSDKKGQGLEATIKGTGIGKSLLALFQGAPAELDAVETADAVVRQHDGALEIAIARTTSRYGSLEGDFSLEPAGPDRHPQVGGTLRFQAAAIDPGAGELAAAGLADMLRPALTSAADGSAAGRALALLPHLEGAVTVEVGLASGEHSAGRLTAHGGRIRWVCDDGERRCAVHSFDLTAEPDALAARLEATYGDADYAVSARLPAARSGQGARVELTDAQGDRAAAEWSAIGRAVKGQLTLNVAPAGPLSREAAQNGLDLAALARRIGESPSAPLAAQAALTLDPDGLTQQIALTLGAGACTATVTGHAPPLVKGQCRLPRLDLDTAGDDPGEASAWGLDTPLDVDLDVAAGSITAAGFVLAPSPGVHVKRIGQTLSVAAQSVGLPVGALTVRALDVGVNLPTLEVAGSFQLANRTVTLATRRSPSAPSQRTLSLTGPDLDASLDYDSADLRRLAAAIDARGTMIGPLLAAADLPPNPHLHHLAVRAEATLVGNGAHGLSAEIETDAARATFRGEVDARGGARGALAVNAPDLVALLAMAGRGDWSGMGLPQPAALTGHANVSVSRTRLELQALDVAVGDLHVDGNATLQAPGAGKPVDLSLRFAAQHAAWLRLMAVPVPAEIAHLDLPLSGAVTVSQSGEVTSWSGFQIQAGDVRVSSSGSASPAGLHASVALEAAGLKTLTRISPVPIALPPTLDLPVHADATLAGTPSQVALQDARFRLGPMSGSFTGQFRATNPPILDGTIELQAPRSDQLASLLSDGTAWLPPPMRAAPVTLRARVAAQQDQVLLGGIDAGFGGAKAEGSAEIALGPAAHQSGQLHVQLAHLPLAGLPLDDGRFLVEWSQPNPDQLALHVGVEHLAGYHGAVTGNLAVTAHAPWRQIELNQLSVKTSTIDLAAVCRETPWKVFGRGAAEAALELHGNGPIDLERLGEQVAAGDGGALKQLSGSGRISIQDGRLLFVDLDQPVDNRREIQILSNPHQGTRIEQASLPFELRNGQISISDGQMRSKLLHLTLGGSYDLQRSLMDFRIAGDLVAMRDRNDASSVVTLGLIPVQLSGSPDDVKVHFDSLGHAAGGILIQSITIARSIDQVLQDTQNSLDNSFSDLIRPFFSKDHRKIQQGSGEPACDEPSAVTMR